MTTLNLNCPRCGSENTKSFPMVHQQGISTIDLDTTSVGGGYQFGEGGGAFVLGTSGSASGTSQSSLSMATAPPKRKASYAIVGYVLAAIVAAVFTARVWQANWILGLVWSAMLLGGFGLWAKSLMKRYENIENYNEKEYPRLYKNWQNSYLCFRCGASFTAR